MKKWREELKEWRKVANKIQKEAADEIGVPVETYRGWECERHEPPEYVKNLIRKKIYGD